MGLGIVLVFTAPMAALVAALAGFVAGDVSLADLVAGAVASLAAAPFAVLAAFAGTFVAVLVGLRHRARASGHAIEALGIAVLVAMVGGAGLAGVVFRDPAPAVVVVAWLIWPGVTLVREGRHLGRRLPGVGGGATAVPLTQAWVAW